MSTKIGTLTRTIAINALGLVLQKKMHADVALEKLFAKEGDKLRPLDKAFVFEIVYGSLRWLSKMDWIVGHMMDRPFSSLDPKVANSLRVGIYQIFYMDRVPDRAAVSETVEATKFVGARNASSFVNAVLRRVARRADYFPKPDKEKSPIDYYSMQYSYPRWMVERWFKMFPLDRFEYLCVGNNKQPKHCLRAVSHNPLALQEDLATYLIRNYGITSSWRPMKGALRVDKLPPFENCEAYFNGAYIVQDEAAQLMTTLVAPSTTDKVLDACAAPGGKSIALWDLGVRPENLTVCDVSQKRIDILNANFARVNLQNTIIKIGDIAEVVSGEKYNKILLDAPCSGLGVIKKHPEIKWLRSYQDLLKCAKEQERLLNVLCENLEPNGELIYVVCSVEPEETTIQIDSFLAKHPDFKRVPLYGRIHDYYKKYVTHREELVVVPGNSDEIDGFFGVVLSRSA